MMIALAANDSLFLGRYFLLFFTDHGTGVDINTIETGLLARDWLFLCTYLTLALVLVDRFSLTISSYGIDDD